MLAASMMISSLLGESYAAAQENNGGNVPGMHLLNEPNTIRALGIGTSHKKNISMLKAKNSALSQLAQMIDTAVDTAIDDYYVALEEGQDLVSKRFINEKIRTMSNQVISGARIIFNEMYREESGQYSCYIVLDLSPEEYAASVAASSGDDVQLDTAQFKKSLIKAINAK